MAWGTSFVRPPGQSPLQRTNNAISQQKRNPSYLVLCTKIFQAIWLERYVPESVQNTKQQNTAAIHSPGSQLTIRLVETFVQKQQEARQASEVLTRYRHHHRSVQSLDQLLLWSKNFRTWPTSILDVNSRFWTHKYYRTWRLIRVGFWILNFPFHIELALCSNMARSFQILGNVGFTRLAATCAAWFLHFWSDCWLISIFWASHSVWGLVFATVGPTVGLFTIFGLHIQFG